MANDVTYVKAEDRVRTLRLADGDMHTASVRVSNEHDDWHTIHVTDDEESAAESKASMLLGLKAACEDVRELCAVAALSLEPNGVQANKGIKWGHGKDIAVAIRSLEL